MAVMMIAPRAKITVSRWNSHGSVGFAPSSPIDLNGAEGGSAGKAAVDSGHTLTARSPA
ncbi:hypothetical protein D3C78_1487180 [compost metagenome]